MVYGKLPIYTYKKVFDLYRIKTSAIYVWKFYDPYKKNFYIPEWKTSFNYTLLQWT